MEKYNQDNQDVTIDIGLILLKLCNFRTIRNIVLCGIICGICFTGLLCVKNIT